MDDLGVPLFHEISVYDCPDARQDDFLKIWEIVCLAEEGIRAACCRQAQSPRQALRALDGRFKIRFLFPNHSQQYIGNVIIPTDFHSIIFQRGRSTTNQITMVFIIINHC